jgi:Ca2+-binding RTX toxin-like protein
MSLRPPGTLRTTRNRFRPTLEALEGLNLPSTLVLLDFNGATQAEVDAASDYARSWRDRPTSGGLVGFVQGFSALNAEGFDRFSFLDFDRDGDLDASDGEWAVNLIVANVQQDFAPYDVIVRREDVTSRGLEAMRGFGHDTMIFVNGGPTAAGGQAPFDPENSEPNIGAAGDTGGVAHFLADRGFTGTAARDFFINFISSATAHEVGHTFGLDHVDVTAHPDANDRNLMDPFLADRDMSFWDVSLNTPSGMQNQHQYLTRVLGASTHSWAAVLQPGELYLKCGTTSTAFTVVPDLASPGDLRVIDGTRLVANHVDPSDAPDINSLNQFQTAITTIQFVGSPRTDFLDVSDTITIGVYAEGGGGDDNLVTGGGADVLIGGTGHDTLTGGRGNDFILAGTGDDRVNGGAGDDYIAGESNNDVLYGGSGNDTVGGQAGDDLVFGGFGNDTLYGGDDNDVLVGGANTDRLYGGAGRDITIGGTGSDEVRGGTGDDIVIGGSTSHDNDENALRALSDEWTSAHDYATRVSYLRSGGGLNGTYILNGRTVFDDFRADSLYGEADRDWFWSLPLDSTPDRAIWPVHQEVVG